MAHVSHVILESLVFYIVQVVDWPPLVPQHERHAPATVELYSDDVVLEGTNVAPEFRRKLDHRRPIFHALCIPRSVNSVAPILVPEEIRQIFFVDAARFFYSRVPNVGGLLFF